MKNQLANLCYSLLTISALAIWLVGCTVIPPRVHDQQPSFDGNAQNSGLLRFADDGSIFITPHAADRYNALCARYGSRFLPPIHAGDGLRPAPPDALAGPAFLLDAQHLAAFARMNAWAKAEASPQK